MCLFSHNLFRKVNLIIIFQEYYDTKTCAFLRNGRRNLVIDGRSSTLIFHGLIHPITFDYFANIILKNISIDREAPFVAQGEVLKIIDQYINLGVNYKEFPYRLKNEKLVFQVYGKRLTNGKQP